ncbi:hypothetical protein MATL_G00208040 [Megalops atlanticus]|uniref:Uncharacterized protein n=1 Tax=Megalops atlanticus TaxID=7932 RepID=A0A9D3T575_MEGAT|nr:hypothetical protein MATL_G00208040 [Megalops atlanticus]
MSACPNSKGTLVTQNVRQTVSPRFVSDPIALLGGIDEQTRQRTQSFITLRKQSVTKLDQLQTSYFSGPVLCLPVGFSGFLTDSPVTEQVWTSDKEGHTLTEPHCPQ